MVSNPGGGGLSGSIERCFELCWWHVTAVAVKPFVVEPVHPAEGGEFEFVDVVPWLRGVGPVDAFGLVEPDSDWRLRCGVGRSVEHRSVGSCRACRPVAV